MIQIATIEAKTTEQIHAEIEARLSEITHDEEALKAERERLKDALRALEGKKKPGRPAQH